MPALAAEPVNINSVEWLALRADVIVTGTIIASRSQWVMTEVDVRVTRDLKGSPQHVITFVYDSFGDKRVPIGSLQGEHLFFLLRGLNIPPGKRHDPKAWERLTLQERDVNVLSLDRLKDNPAFSCTFQVLRNVDEIAAAIRSNGTPVSQPRSLVIRPPPGSPAFDVLGSNRAAVLQIPADDRWKLPYLQYLTRTPNWWEFIKNPQPLKSFEATMFMTALLDDPAWEPAHSPRWNHSITAFERRNYTTRRAAYNILLAWGNLPPQPTLKEPLLPIHRFPRELMFAPLLFVPLLVFPRTTSLPRRLFNLATLVSALTAIFLCALLIRSRFYYDDVIFATPTGQYEFSSFQGRLQYLVVNDQPQPHNARFRSTSLHDPRSVPDHIGYLYPAQTFTHLGVERASGITPPDDGSWRFPYHLTRVRFATLLIPVLLLPGVRLAAWSARCLTARIRRRRNLCPNCGYDLRSSPDRCPECGRPAKMP